MYGDGEYDLAGFAVGAVERGKLLPRKDIAAGDVMLALPSSGVHSNGFSLVRRVVERRGCAGTTPAPVRVAGERSGEALLAPTRIYVARCLSRSARPARSRRWRISPAAGSTENIPRVLPDGLAAEIDLGAIAAAAGLRLAASARARIDQDEMLRTFNCGVGMILVVSRKGRRRVLAQLCDAAHRSARLPSAAAARRALQGRACARRAALTRKRVGVLISGRGSKSASPDRGGEGPDYPAEIMLVISNVPGARGLARAESRRHRDARHRPQGFACREDFEWR